VKIQFNGTNYLSEYHDRANDLDLKRGDIVTVDDKTGKMLIDTFPNSCFVEVKDEEKKKSFDAATKDKQMKSAPVKK
jgi:hypothetical protein